MNWFRHKESLPLTPYVKPIVTEADIEEAAAPLAHGTVPEEEIGPLCQRIRDAVSKLSYDDQPKLYEMMDRIGHSIRKL